MSFLNGNRKKGEQSRLGGSIVQVGLAATMASMLSACGGGGSGVTATEVDVAGVPSVRMQLGSLDFTIPKSGELNNVVDTSLKTFLTKHFTGNTANEIEAKYKSLKKELFGDENTTDYKIEVDGDNIYIAGTVKDANGSVTSSRLGVLEQVKGADEKLETVKLFSFESTSQDFTAATTLKDEVDKNEASHKVVIDVDGIVDALTTDGDDVFELLKKANSIKIKGGEGTDTLEIKIFSKGETVTLTGGQIDSIEEFVVVDGVGLNLSRYVLNELTNEGVTITIVDGGDRQSPLEDVSWFSRNEASSTAIVATRGNDRFVYDSVISAPETLLDGGDGEDTLEIDSSEEIYLGDNKIKNIEVFSIKGGGINLLNYDKKEGVTINVDRQKQDEEFSIGGTKYSDKVVGDNHDNTVYGFMGNDAIQGNDGHDVLYGYKGDDVISGGLGNDKLYGGEDEDTLNGNEGNDEISGGLGNDKLYGGEHEDTLYGHKGDDEISGGTGDDKLYGGEGADTLVGGVGNDILTGGDGSDRFIHSGVTSEKLSDGFDTIIDFDKDSDEVIFKEVGVNEIKWIPFSGARKLTNDENGKETFDHGFYFTGNGLYAVGATGDGNGSGCYIVSYESEKNFLLKLQGTKFLTEFLDDKDVEVFKKGKFDDTTITKVEVISFKKATIDLGKNNLDANGWGKSEKIPTESDGFKVDNGTHNHLYVAYDSVTGHMPLFTKDAVGKDIAPVFADGDADGIFDFVTGTSYFAAHNNYKFSWKKIKVDNSGNSMIDQNGQVLTEDLTNTYYLNLDTTADSGDKVVLEVTYDFGTTTDKTDDITLYSDIITIT